MTKPQKSLLYCRVSSQKQDDDGSGLESQEHRARLHSAELGLEVEKVFADSVSGRGDFMKRKGMVDLIQYLEDNAATNYVVIFDDLKRLARSTISHLTLRLTLKKYGATVSCPNYKFDETPEGQFIETLFAAQGELEARQTKRQTMQKMKARIEQGFWIFPAVIGYKYVKAPGGGKILVKDEPFASIITEALEGFASGRFQTKAEVRRFLESFPEYPRMKNGQIHGSRIEELLTRVIYSGYVEYDGWNVSLRQGQHEGLISYETFLKNQERLNGVAHAPARKNINADFPLRGFISCTCNNPLTAGWTKGRNKHYPYYYCQTKGCEHSGKSIKRDVLHAEFDALLKQLAPPQSVMSVYSDMIEEEWDYQEEYAKSRQKSLRLELGSIDKEIDKLVDRVVELEDADVIKAFEGKIKKKRKEKLLIDEKLANCGRPIKGFDETYRTAMEFLQNPHSYWASGVLEYQRTVLKLAFTERLVYARGEGYRTAKTAIPFRLFKQADKVEESPECGVNTGFSEGLVKEEIPTNNSDSEPTFLGSEWMVPGPDLNLDIIN